MRFYSWRFSKLRPSNPQRSPGCSQVYPEKILKSARPQCRMQLHLVESGTNTKCLILRHFCSFPQIDEKQPLMAF
jgi:hypothetical protein